jgi:hypothetical protein
MAPYFEGIRVSEDFVPKDEDFGKLGTVGAPNAADANRSIAIFKD